MKASVLHNPRQEQSHMDPPLAATGCGSGNQAASLFQQAEPPPPPPLTLFSERGCEVTCDRSGSRKRPRDGQPPLGPLSSASLYQQQQQQQMLLQRQLLLLNQMHRRQTKPAADVLVDSSRIDQSALASTSGRPPLVAVKLPVASPSDQIRNATVSPPPGMVQMLHDHNQEVDALFRLHVDKLRLAVNQSCKRHCRAVVSALEQQVQRRVAEKQAEMDAAVKRSAELEDRLRQAKAETQAWTTFAKNSEATVSRLRASLKEALLQKLTGGKKGSKNGGNWSSSVVLPFTTPEEVEGYGDSEDDATTAASAASAAALSGQPTQTDRLKPSVGASCSFVCRSCGSSEACVLLLPCRHLCLCQLCEPSVEDCPVCRSRKNASLPINLS